MKFMGNVMAYVAAALLLAYAWLELVPHDFLSTLGQPAHLATLGGILGLVALLGSSIWPLPARQQDALMAQVLASMPVFYLWGALQQGGPLAVLTELLGLAAFGALAWYGWRHKPVLLGLGIIAHGLLWDSWHHQHSSVLPTWYPLACGLYDVAFGLLALMRHRTLALQAQPPERPIGLGRNSHRILS